MQPLRFINCCHYYFLGADHICEALPWTSLAEIIISIPYYTVFSDSVLGLDYRSPVNCNRNREIFFPQLEIFFILYHMLGYPAGNWIVAPNFRQGSFGCGDVMSCCPYSIGVCAKIGSPDLPFCTVLFIVDKAWMGIYYRVHTKTLICLVVIDSPQVCLQII